MKQLTILFLLLISFSCTNKDENKATDNILTFGDFVELEKLNKVEMSNNYGIFNLSVKQIDRIREELSQMVYDPNVAVKVGAINIELTIDRKTYNISSATHSDYIEVHKDIVTKNKSSVGTSDWLYFKTGKINFDNYKNENQ